MAIGNQKLKLALSTELLIVAREGTYFEVADKRTEGVGRQSERARSLFDNGGHKKYVNHSSVTRLIGGRKDPGRKGRSHSQRLFSVGKEFS